MKMFSPLSISLGLSAALVTLMSGLVYVAVQQNYRMNANDPQIELSQEISDALTQGQNPAALQPQGPPSDLGKSMAAFFIIYNATGTVYASSAALNGKPPVPPSGVFDSTTAHGEDRFTWEPQPGVRIAAVVNSWKGTNGSGFVLVGRSLQEVEKREKALTEEVAMAWIASLAVIGIGGYLLTRKQVV